MSEIDDLLQKLRPLDAPTYENICKWGLNWNHPGEAALSEYIIQGEVQRAIDAKRLRYLTSTHYDALDRIFYAAEVRDHENFDLSKGGSYESMTSAMLSAYISCLESQP